LLKEKGLYDNSVILLTADHGESFMEHGKWGHGKTLYQSEIRVPLLIRFPANQMAGKRIRSVARHLDVLPTLLDLYQLPVPVSLQGSSLLPLLAEDQENEIPVFSELNLDRHRARSILSGNYKLIHSFLRPVSRVSASRIRTNGESRRSESSPHGIHAGYLPNGSISGKTQVGAEKPPEQCWTKAEKPSCSRLPAIDRCSAGILPARRDHLRRRAAEARATSVLPFLRQIHY
jgi:hypothetical protein